MFFQKVLKGISGIDQAAAEHIILNTGIVCNWWHKKDPISSLEIKEQLTEDNLIHHLNDYDKPLPAGHKWKGVGATYGDVTPFISTTAGAVQRDNFNRTNVIYNPFVTALNFATEGFTTDGWLFYAYLITIGKKAVPLRAFSEEVRELHVYTKWLPYHQEGEITAKIDIPSVQIEKAEMYSGPKVLAASRAMMLPVPDLTIDNPLYEPPERYTNLKELL